MATILVVDDEVVLARQIAAFLTDCGHDVNVAGSAKEGEECLQETGADLVLLDLKLPDRTGLEVLDWIQELDKTIAVVLMTAYGSVPDVVRAMQSGAADYLQKPLDLEELSLLVERIMARKREARELAYHRKRDRTEAPGVVASHPSMQEILEQLNRLREAEIPPGRRPPLLFTGETGTGKGLFARTAHDMLGNGPFIEVNCTAMPESLMEAELFGHERGTFTDAKSSRTGLFDAAAGGTLFLDEIGHASLDLQAKLLKVIEDRRVRRLGATRDHPVDVHVMAASNRNLDEAVVEQEFRSDLLYRLRVLSFEVPPLRDRASDIPLLAKQFCEEFGRAYRRTVSTSDEAIRELESYAWPGNVRELRNVMERVILLGGGGELDARSFSGALGSQVREVQNGVYQLPENGVQLAELEREAIRQALERSDGNRRKAAELLGLTRDTLRYRLSKFGLDEGE